MAAVIIGCAVITQQRFRRKACHSLADILFPRISHDLEGSCSNRRVRKATPEAEISPSTRLARFRMLPGGTKWVKLSSWEKSKKCSSGSRAAVYLFAARPKLLLGQRARISGAKGHSGKGIALHPDWMIAGSGSSNQGLSVSVVCLSGLAEGVFRRSGPAGDVFGL